MTGPWQLASGFTNGAEVSRPFAPIIGKIKTLGVAAEDALSRSVSRLFKYLDHALCRSSEALIMWRPMTGIMTVKGDAVPLAESW